MAKIYFNKEVEGKGKVWTAQNGATRRTLVLIFNQEDFPNGISTEQEIIGRLGYLDKGNHSFIFINKNKKNDNNILGVFLNGNYGYKCHTTEKEIYSNRSIGGYGNSESKFGIYKEGAIIETETYKNRTPTTFYFLTSQGWRECGTEDDIYANADDEYCQKIINILNDKITEIE